MSFNQFLDELHYIFIHSSACLSMPMNTTRCFNFWGVCYLAGFLVVLIVFIKVLRKVLKDRSDWRKYLLKIENRDKVADAETMAKSVWRGDF